MRSVGAGVAGASELSGQRWVTITGQVSGPGQRVETHYQIMAQPHRGYKGLSFDA